MSKTNYLRQERSGLNRDNACLLAGSKKKESLDPKVAFEKGTRKKG